MPVAGKTPDLVLLSANPLEDSTNTRRLEAIVTRWRPFARRCTDAAGKWASFTMRPPKA